MKSAANPLLAQSEAWSPYTASSIRVALHPISRFLASKSFLVAQLPAIAEEVQDQLPDSPKKRATFKALPFLQGLENEVATLFNAGIRSLEDLEDRSAQEILSLQGIGKVTLQKLKANGVRFKED